MHAALADRVRQHGTFFPLAVPGSGSLYEMITGLAARAGLTLEPGLAQQLVDDTGAAPGGLALLAFAQHELYEAGVTDRQLTRKAYRAFNGVKGAIAKRADTTLDGLPTAVQAALPSVFGELVEVDERGLATRRRAALDGVAASMEAGKLIDAFTKARLLVTDSGPSGVSIVEVAHEALLREWPRLATWITERADDLRLMRQVEAAASEWVRADRDSHYLWPQERLTPVDAAIARLGKARQTLEESVRSFIQPEVDRIQTEPLSPATTHQRRAAIGDRLDKLGDPRTGVGLRRDGVPDIVWCAVPSGTVSFEYGQGTFTVPSFLMAKYPVTYRQYKTFLDDDDGYRSEQWWTDLKREESPGEQYRPTANHPAENVSWYDAIAYARWLSVKLGYEVRLPTEAAWQQAATSGEPSFEYPWGAQWGEHHADTNETRLSRTIAVGMYPAGVSRQGLYDISGNVWEWCLDLYEQPGVVAIKVEQTRSKSKTSRDDDPMRVRRVVRGGSWVNLRDDARAACRNDVGPGDRGDLIGFRLLSVSPILLNR
ncbi:MAG: formylglycine-generating enzyme family protein [Burkholderiales bacterium]